jgi:hypothetical protein
MTRFSSLHPVVAVLVAASVLTVTTRASAAERPHVSRGTAQFTPTGFVGTGYATHLGQYTEVGAITFGDPTGPTTVAITAWSTYTAASGDELHARFSGELNVVTGAITATVTYVGGTGRFDGASGSAALSGQLLPDGTIAVSVVGTIDY